MPTLDVTAFAYGMKVKYSAKKVLTAVAQDNPGYAMASKDTSASAGNNAYAIEYSIPNRSSTFATALSRAGYTRGVQPQLTMGDDFGIVNIDLKLMEGAKGNLKALVDSVTSQTDGVLTSLKNNLGRCFFGDGSGQLATISASAALGTTTLLLTNAEDIVHFYVGQNIVFAANNTSALRSSTPLTVSAINEDAGSMTLSATPNSLAAGIAVGDAIFTEGDYVSASDRLQMRGLNAWCPLTAPTAGDSFFSIDRSVHVTGLAGHRFTDASTYAGYSTEEAILLLMVRIARGGGQLNTAFVSFDRWHTLVESLGTKVEFSKKVPIKSEGKLVAEVAFDGVRVHGPKGMVEVYPDRSCPANTIFVGDINVVDIMSIGDSPHWVSDISGQRLRTMESANSVQMRLVAWPQMGIRRPGSWGRFDWT